ncbi:periplasmic Murein Peptide-Binding Protein MppA [Klebsiella variicola]|nr:periplasmic Murein Peptide-Binding Protein MppA [Klebsiella variicola]
MGNGAYVLKDRVVNEKLVVVPNTHYWDNAKTVIQQVTFVADQPGVRRHQALSRCDIDITESFPKNMYQKLLKDIPGQVYTPAAAGYLLLRFQYQKGPTADERVRLALSMTIDRRVMAEKVLGTGEKPAWRFTPDVDGGLHPPAVAV